MSDTETKTKVYATLVRGETFTIVKTGKKFVKGVAKSVNELEFAILEAQVEQVCTTPGDDETAPEFTEFPKFKFSDKPAAEADEAAPRARTRTKAAA